MKLFSLYYSLLEQTPSTPPATDPEKHEETAPEATDPATDLVTTKTKVEAGVAAGGVVDEKLANLESGHKNMAEIMASKANLSAFLAEGNSQLDQPVAVEKLINDVEGLFEKAIASYCKLSPSESKHMATGVVCSFVDSVTYALNTPAQTETKTTKKGEKTDKKEESKFGMLKVFGEVAGNLLGKAKDGKALNLGGMESIFTNIEGAFGSYEVLEQRTKSIFVLMELTRKAKGLFINPATGTSKEILDRNGRIANDPNKFVTATRILETAYKGNKDVVKPEYMNAKSDFLQVLDLTDSNAKPPKSAKLNLLQLLGLQGEGTIDERFVVSDYFADLSPDEKRDPEVAKGIISGLQKAVEFGDEAIKNRDHNKTAFSPMKKQTNNLLESFKPLLGDENDPDSLYSTFRKWINLFRGMFTGESFDEVKYDDSELSSGVVTADQREEYANTLLGQFANGSLLWHTTNIIFARESQFNYGAVNPSDGDDKMCSIGLMQWHGERSGDLIERIKNKDPKLLLDETVGLGKDFGKFITDNSDWYKKTQYRGHLDGKKRIPNQFDCDDNGNELEPQTPLPERKKDRYSRLEKLLDHTVAREAANEKAGTDVQNYIGEIAKVAGKDINNLTLEEKKCFVFMGRLWNAGGNRAEGFLRKNMSNGLDLKTLYDAALENPRNTEKDLIQGVRDSIQKTFEYCSAIQS